MFRVAAQGVPSSLVSAQRLLDDLDPSGSRWLMFGGGYTVTALRDRRDCRVLRGFWP